MKYENINKRYTEVVAEYIAKGYYFNTATMGGSQGEVAHADLTNGVEIIRIVLDRFNECCKEDDYIDYEGLQLIVGRCTEERVKPNTVRDGTIWNNRLEVISCEKFYQIGRENRNGQKFYGTMDEAKAARMMNIQRWKINHKRDEKKELPEAARAAVLPWVKRQPKCKSVKLADIEKVYSVVSHSIFNNSCKKQYFVTVKGNKMRIG